MKSVEPSLHSVTAGPSTEEDLGFNLGVSSADTGAVGSGRPWRNVGPLTGLWLLWSVVLAVAALYLVVAAEGRLLAWTAAGGAVALLLGALLLRRHQADQASLSPALRSLLSLAAFAAPLGQVLVTLVHGSDAGATHLVLLLVVGYALVTPSTESLLVYLTLSLVAWTACVSGLPAGAWHPHVVPWFAATALAMLVVQRRVHSVGRVSARGTSTGVLDLDREQQLRTAHTARDETLARCRQLEEQLRDRPRHAEPRWEEELFFLQESARELAQDVTLNEVGAGWLERLSRRLGAQQVSLWLAKDGAVKLIMGWTEADAGDVEALLDRAVQAGQLVQTGDAWALPLDLGLQGRGVLLLQGVAEPASASFTKLLHTCGSALNLFLRWQLSDAESESVTQQLHQEQEKQRGADQAWHLQVQTAQSVAEHLKQELAAAQQERGHWQAEAESQRRTLEQAGTDYDTLQQLLQDTEAELKRVQAEGASQGQLQVRMRKLEAECESATASWQKTEEQLEESETARRRAEEEARDAVEEWQRETSAVARLTLVLRGVADAAAVFDAAGEALFENEAAQALRGPIRNRPGEHPLWQAVTPESRAAARRDGQWQGEVYVHGLHQQGRAHQVTVRTTKHGPEEYALTAHRVESEEERQRQRQEIEAARAEAARSGSRFFTGLARTLRPPVAGLIEQAERFLENAGNADLRRTALLGVLKHARFLRGFLTQVFDYVELETGTAAVVKTRLSPWQVLHDTVARYRPFAEEQGLELNVLARGPLPPAVMTDTDRLCQILAGLLAFAVRMTPGGKVTVWAGMEEASLTRRQTPRLEFGVDLSQGPKAWPVEPSFEPFGEAGQDGLNLALASRQANALGGEVRAERLSALGGRLVFSLPITPVEMASVVTSHELPLEDESTPADAVAPLQGRVLVVLDHHDAQRVVTFHLERLGVRAECTSDGATALIRVRDEAYQAVLWQADLQDFSPLAAVDQLRNAGYPGAIFLLATGKLGDVREEFLRAGGQGVLTLPVAPALWRQLLAGCLSTVDAEDQGEVIRSEFHGDGAFLPLVRGFVARLSGLVAEMRAALLVADIAGLARLTHALAENARLYGYPALAESAQAAEGAILQGCDSHQLGTRLDALRETVRRIERGVRDTAVSGLLTMPGAMRWAA